jgi:hypothetical protein
MSDPTTPIIGLNVPTTGTDTGTWGLSLNANWDAMDGAVGGITQISIVGGTTNLVPTQLPFGTIQFIGALTSNALIVVPVWAGFLTVMNSTTGAYTLTVILNGQPKSIVVPQGSHVNMFFVPTGPTTVGFQAGTVMLFAQAAAPLGWTQLTTVNDAALRIVNGASGGTTTGSVGLSAFIAAGDNPVALTLTQIPAHTHTLTDPGHHHQSAVPNVNVNVQQPGGTSVWASSLDGSLPTSTSLIGIAATDSSGSGGTHAHTFPSLYYLDALYASKA